jgi:hypothetical protein
MRKKRKRCVFITRRESPAEDETQIYTYSGLVSMSWRPGNKKGGACEVGLVRLEKKKVREYLCHDVGVMGCWRGRYPTS